MLVKTNHSLVLVMLNLLSFKVLPGVPEPAVYWSEDDPRAKNVHLGILSQIVLDFR